MKKVKILIILLSILIVLAMLTFVCLKTYKSNEQDNVEEKSIEKNDISINITFKSTNYLNIDNKIFYYEDEELDEQTLEDLHVIAQTLKEDCPEIIDLLYVNSFGGNPVPEGRTYRFVQMSKGVEIENSDLNITCLDYKKPRMEQPSSAELGYGDGICFFTSGIKVQYLFGEYNKEIKEYNIKISKTEAQNIVEEYLKTHKEEYEEMQSPFTTTIICTSRLYYFKNEVVWSMRFNRTSYILISVTTGKIIDKRFWNGVIWD